MGDALRYVNKTHCRIRPRFQPVQGEIPCAPRFGEGATDELHLLLQAGVAQHLLNGDSFRKTDHGELVRKLALIGEGKGDKRVDWNRGLAHVKGVVAHDHIDGHIRAFDWQGNFFIKQELSANIDKVRPEPVNLGAAQDRGDIDADPAIGMEFHVLRRLQLLGRESFEEDGQVIGVGGAKG